MKKISLVLVAVVLVIALISPVSSYDFEKSFAETHYQDGWAKYTTSNDGTSMPSSFNGIYSNRVQDFVGIKSIVTTMSLYSGFPKSGVSKSTTFEGFIGETYVCSGTIGYNINHDAEGNWKNTIYYILFDDFDPKQFSGSQYITMVWDTDIVQKPLYSSSYYRSISSPNEASDDYLDSYIAFAPQNTGRVPIGITSQYYLSHNWYQTLGINDYDYYLDVYLDRHSSASEISIIDTSSGAVLYTNTSTLDAITRLYSPNINITILSPLNTYSFEYQPQEVTDDKAVTVYARNSQTNALIADTHIVISASIDNEFHEIINKTLPSGIYTGILQPTGGGMPNPDFYQLIATAEGYNSIMPYIDFEVDGATTIYAYLDPIGGAPEDENNTFIDFFVRDMSANPISGATVNFGGYTLITNSAGYTIFEVDKNKTYSWTVSKSGYGSLTGNVVIGADPRHTINTVLAPAVTPTTTTPIPTSTSISPTPTMTAPTGEPVSNWLEWFAAHFGMLLGGGAEIGKIFMWLCFSVPVGVYVGKESKAGAAGFMAGAGVVTLFFVLIGWVPIWLLVLLALIIGLLYAKVFNNSDTGGGR